MMFNHVSRLATAAAAAACLLAACAGPSRLTLDGQVDGRMEGRMDGRVDAAVKLEGPVEIHLRGPTIRYQGTYISDDLVDEVETGKTTDDWVLAVFGEPTSRADLRDGSTIWRWTYKPLEQEGSVIDVFTSDEKQPKLAARTVFVQFRDAVVIRKWKG